MQNSSNLKTLTVEAKKLFAQVRVAEEELVANFDHAAEHAWEFGKRLNQLKKIVGHGNWIKWRNDAFSGLDDRCAQRAQALDRMNPNAQTFAHLSAESLRKYRFGYIPVKDRPKLKGDGKFPRPSHHSSVVNECNKLMQRIKARQYKPNLNELRRDFQPFYNWLSTEIFRMAPGKESLSQSP